ncbi:MAG: hypothetical protein U0Z53_18060 [Blastocatellia bacterium]
MNSATNITPARASLATRLLHAVLAKTFLELLLICVLVSLAAYWYFNPQLRGAVDVVSAQRVAGWAADPHRPGEAIEVQLFIDGRFAAVSTAGERRDDLVSAGATTSPFHGFSFAPETLKLVPGSHTAQVYAVRPSAEGSRILVPLSEKKLLFEVR